MSIGPMTGRGKVLVVLPRGMRNSQKSIRYIASATVLSLFNLAIAKRINS